MDSNTVLEATFGLFAGSVQRPPDMSVLRTNDSYVQEATSGNGYQQRFNVPLGIEGTFLLHPLPIVALPIFGFRFEGTAGPAFNQTVDAGANTYHLHLANGFQGECLLPGLGIHLPLGPTLIAASVQPTFAFNTASGNVVRNGLTTDASAIGGSLGIDGKLSGCWHPHGDDDSADFFTCLYLAPLGIRVEHDEHALLNGVLIGFEVRAMGRMKNAP